ncbi:beta-lactamase family protein, partial [Candidatus Bipolaricaulota bacterium]|nr:beta-lactamase family protein [Candidatus Bipolaricaulota bacterium]
MRYDNELDGVLQQIIDRWRIPGMAVGMVEGTEVVYAKGFGVQSLETQVPVALDSAFSTASVSKCFVATAVVQLAERGRIDLDAPLVQYLPYFRMDDDRHRQITIRQMLSHTSGMPDIHESEYDDMVAHPESDDGSAERFVRGLSDSQLIANPGERFSYSNIAYNALGDLIAKVSNMPFERYMRDQILIPSGMEHSGFFFADLPSSKLAVPHLRTPVMTVNPLQQPYHRADAPSSFLYATILDMCHWGITCLHRGTYLGQSILSEASYDTMWTPVAEWGGSRPAIYEDMGLGWTLGHFKGTSAVSHGGMGFGWSAFLLILPERNRAAAILCNEESFARNRTVRAVADTLVDEMPQANTVSWMVPISRALDEGGIQAAYACYEEIKASGDNEYYLDEDDLLNLVIQLTSAKKLDLAMDVLGLNIHAYPQYADSYLRLARIYLQKGDDV